MSAEDKIERVWCARCVLCRSVPMEEYLNQLSRGIRRIKSEIRNIEFDGGDVDSDEEVTDPRLVLLYEQLAHERIHMRNVRYGPSWWTGGDLDPDSVICVI